MESDLKKFRPSDDTQVETPWGSSGGRPAPGQAAFDQNVASSIEMPSLVFSILVKTTRDICLLKIFRLVCKSWNDHAVPTLRLHSFVRLDENQLGLLQNFQNLLLTGEISELPSPFRNFHLKASNLSENSFISLINQPNITITNFSLMTPDARQLDLARFEALFEAKGSTMAELSFNDNRKYHELKTLLSRKKRHLTVEDHCYPECVHKERFLKMFIQDGIFEKIRIEFTDFDVLPRVLTPDKLKHVLELDLKSGGRKVWEFLGSCIMPGLKLLKIDTPAEEFDTFWQEVMTNVSATIEVLDILYMDLVMMTGFPVMGKLKRIICHEWKDEFALFSSARFPVLECVELCILHSIQAFMPTSGFCPHDKVKSVKIELESTDNWGDFSMKHFHVLLDYLKCQFPKITNFKLTTRTINDSTFLAIHNAFPELRGIGLDGGCDFESISGIDIEMVDDYLNNGLATEDIPRKCSIFNFSKLEDLHLTSKVLVTNDMIVFCLDSINPLKTLAFHWNGELDIEVARDCLSHVGHIEILNGADYPQILEKLRGYLNIVEVEES
ncbi:unnamed protein product [Allacma fusca]|uniref:Uncharacterized protein n=1 Tax=Allacma fusca TaxID=39272 RepID=A0A8J2NV80_9HEXA|nr:unnamed protein product [Allacma fusca]